MTLKIVRTRENLLNEIVSTFLTRTKAMDKALTQQKVW